MIRKLFLLILALLVCGAVAASASPTMVQGHSCAMALNNDLSAQTQTSYVCPLANATLAGNAVIFAMRFSPTGTVTHTVTDENSDSFTQEQSTTDGTNGVRAVLFCGMTTTGSKIFTVTLTGTAKNTAAMVYEFAGVTNCTKDTSNGNVGASSTSLTAGSITPSSSGDLIFDFVTLASGSIGGSGNYTVGSQSNITWALAGTDINTGKAAQWGQYNSTSAINPTFTMTNAHPFVGVSVALPTSNVGTPRPTSGIRIGYQQQDSMPQSSASSVTLQFPNSGNLIYVAFGAINFYNITALSDPTNGSYTQIGTGSANNSSCQCWYMKNAAAGTFTLTSTMTEGGLTRDDGVWNVFEIFNADASAPLDTTVGTSGFKGATGTQATGGAGGPVTFWSDLTPSGANELIIVNGGEANDTATGVTSPSGSTFVASTWLNGGANTEVNPTMDDENNFKGVYYNGADTTAETWTMTHDTFNTAGIGTWAACGVAFKAAASGGGATAGITKARKLEKIDH